MRLIPILTTVILISSMAQAGSRQPASTVRHFSPGKYKLVDGDPRSCRDGDFKISEDGQYIWLGPLYSFTVHSGVKKAKASFDKSRKDCWYNLSTTVTPGPDKTTFKTVDVLQCGDEKKSEVVNYAEVSADKITLDQRRRVELDSNVSGGQPASCVWKKEASL